MPDKIVESLLWDLTCLRCILLSKLTSGVWKVEANPNVCSTRGLMDRNGTRYRTYSPTAMAKAYHAIKEDGSTIRGAARKYGLPEATLRDRVSGKIGPEVTKSGKVTMFSAEEEARLVEHIKMMASCGYEYTRKEIIDCASVYAVSLNKRDLDHPLSQKWYFNFSQRWPGFGVNKKKNLKSDRAKATSEEAASSYYAELEKIMTAHDLTNTPELIYSVDEKSVKLHQSSGDPSDNGMTVTIIGCGNALGQQIPPYFVFPGQRMRQELLRGGSPGACGTVSESGWSTSDIYLDYLTHHFLKYARGRTDDKSLLLLYDGHRSHISSIPLIDWAQDHNILMYVNPDHLSHTVQSPDLGCFGPFEALYNAECQEFMEKYSCSGIAKHSVCEIACKTYAEALSPSNLQSSFKQVGVFPLMSIGGKSFNLDEPVPKKPRTSSKKTKPRGKAPRKKATTKKVKMTRKHRAWPSPEPGPSETEDDMTSPAPSPTNPSDSTSSSSSSSSSLSSSSQSSDSDETDFED